jgi:hypothetical protein
LTVLLLVVQLRDRHLKLTELTFVVVQLLRIHLRMVDLTMLNLNAVQQQQQQLLLFVTLEQCIVKACPVEGLRPNLGKMGQTA